MNHYKDLFQGLKGGANRFGIVAPCYELHPAIQTGTAADKNWYGLRVTREMLHGPHEHDESHSYGGKFCQLLFSMSYADMPTLISGSARGNGQQFGGAAFVGVPDGYNYLVSSPAHYESQLSASYMAISPVPRCHRGAGRSATLVLHTRP
ncbi:hypothetical protein K438DRAFT_1818055 [Mycena galopus ATCC 62051]|nr:hypothetical protein K438DRAFT_1818055 [Mycena galopus ATCC 62051]